MPGVGKFELYNVRYSPECTSRYYSACSLAGLQWGKCTSVTIVRKYYLTIELADDQDKPVAAKFVFVGKNDIDSSSPAHKLCQQ